MGRRSATWLPALALALVSLAGCDARRIAELEEGVATEADVRARFGEPAQVQTYALKQQEVWDWRYLDGSEGCQFAVTFDAAGRVITSGSTIDPRENTVGGR